MNKTHCLSVYCSIKNLHPHKWKYLLTKTKTNEQMLTLQEDKETRDAALKNHSINVGKVFMGSFKARKPFKARASVERYCWSYSFLTSLVSEEASC